METVLPTIENADIRKILECYREVMKKDHTDTFNVFTLISDLYYRENYHSDILAALLRHKDAGSGRYILLEAFIEILNASKGNDSKKSIDNYTDPDITRESHRIDILIKDKKTRHCIIVENKINDAPDMHRQLPRYYHEMIKEDAHVDAIVYLTMEPNVLPNWLDWSEDEIPLVRDLLITIPVFNSRENVSLVSNWVNPGIFKINDADVLSSLRQYGRLLEKLGENTQQIHLMIELLSKLQNDKQNGLKIEDFIALRDIVNQMPMVMAKDLRSELSSIFNKKDAKYVVTWWQSNSCVVNLDKENAIYVYCDFNEEKAYCIGIADFSKANRSAAWFDISQLGEEYMKNLKSGINSDDYSDFKFQFGFYEKLKMVELIKKLVEQYSAYVKK